MKVEGSDICDNTDVPNDNACHSVCNASHSRHQDFEYESYHAPWFHNVHGRTCQFAGCGKKKIQHGSENLQEDRIESHCYEKNPNGKNDIPPNCDHGCFVSCDQPTWTNASAIGVFSADFQLPFLPSRIVAMVESIAHR